MSYIITFANEECKKCRLAVSTCSALQAVTVLLEAGVFHSKPFETIANEELGVSYQHCQEGDERVRVRKGGLGGFDQQVITSQVPPCTVSISPPLVHAAAIFVSTLFLLKVLAS